MDMEHEQQMAALEAVLFTMGTAVEADRIAKALEISKSDVRALAREMAGRYEAQDRGIRLIELEDSFQLCTKKEYYETLIKIAKQPRKITLTDTLLETLSIIAYKQPVTKLEIEKIRGVRSDHVVNRLVEYALAQELGRLDAPGRPIVFGTTEEFLRHFGLSAVDQLPKINPERLEDFRSEAEEEISEKLKV